MTVADYNRCVEEYADPVYRFMLKNIKDQEKAKDLVQDSFEKLWMNVEQVSAEKARSYLFTTAYHKLIDQVRVDKRYTTMEEGISNQFGHEQQYSDLMEKLEVAISHLPPVQRSVIMLRDYEGYPYRDIAEITGLTEAQVKVYIYRARVFLKEKIGSVEALV